MFAWARAFFAIKRRLPLAPRAVQYLLSSDSARSLKHGNGKGAHQPQRVLMALENRLEIKTPRTPAPIAPGLSASASNMG